LAEIDAVRPELILCLGATAAQSLIGRDFRVTRDRGQIVMGPRDTPVSATVHPSSIVRIREESERAAELDRFVRDLRVATDYQR
jgi:DNA polymerase